MRYREIQPHLALRAFVDRFWIRHGAGEARTARILPDGCIDLIVNLSDGGSLQAIGTMSRAVVVGGSNRFAAVRFRPGGAASFLRIPLQQITDRQVEVADLDLHWLRSVDVPEAPDPTAVIRALERALLRQLDDVGLPNTRIAFAVGTLLQRRPTSIEQVAAALDFTRQHLRRLFVSQVGISPKEFAGIARMQRAVLTLQDPSGCTLSTVAAAAGYFDEAHMDRDFKKLAGVTPSAIRAARGSIRPIRSVFGVA